ncbi:MAG: HK97 family phage prohead protease, partial [Xanthomonas perforans]|nr:HK97 family phage prohead protease [Xanthomonas perforans]
AGAVAGLSVGYRPRVVHQGGARAILSAELIEISLVTVPMQPLARVIHIFTKGK